MERKSTVSPDWVYSLLVSTLLLAFLFIYGLGLPEEVGRIIGVSLFMFVFPLGFLWLGLDSRLNLAEGATVKTSARTKKIYDWIARSIFVAVGVFFFYFVTLPLALDLLGLWSGASLVQVEGEVMGSETSKGRRHLLQGIEIKGDPNSRYDLFFSTEPAIQPGEYIKFQALKRSQLIVKVVERK